MRFEFEIGSFRRSDLFAPVALVPSVPKIIPKNSRCYFLFLFFHHSILFICPFVCPSFRPPARLCKTNLRLPPGRKGIDSNWALIPSPSGTDQKKVRLSNIFSLLTARNVRNDVDVDECNKIQCLHHLPIFALTQPYYSFPTLNGNEMLLDWLIWNCNWPELYLYILPVFRSGGLNFWLTRETSSSPHTIYSQGQPFHSYPLPPPNLHINTQVTTREQFHNSITPIFPPKHVRHRETPQPGLSSLLRSRKTRSQHTTYTK